MDIGQRVRVTIADPDKYAVGAAEALDGMTGVIESLEDKPWHGEVPRRLVRFDEPAPTWFSYQTPPAAFWFPVEDLMEVWAHESGD